MPRCLDQLLAVLRRERRREHADRGQMQLAAAHDFHELWKPPHRARRLDPLVGNALREVQHPLTPGEHRGATLLEIEPPGIDFGEMGEELGLDRVPALDQLPDSREELGFPQS
jgi:hypothetical protein